MHCKRLIQHTLYTAVRISNDIPGFDGGMTHEDDKQAAILASGRSLIVLESLQLDSFSETFLCLQQ